MEATEPFFVRYTRLVPEADVVGAMRAQGEEMARVLGAVGEDVGRVVHPPYTWTVRQVVEHMADTERVFGYRAMRFARGDATPLPGFDQDAYASTAGADDRSLASAVAELAAVRASHVELFASFGPATWRRQGVASGMTWTVEDLGRAIVGHARHHLAILRTRLG